MSREHGVPGDDVGTTCGSEDDPHFSLSGAAIASDRADCLIELVGATAGYADVIVEAAGHERYILDCRQREHELFERLRGCAREETDIDEGVE